MADIRDRTAQARLLQLPADTYTNLRPLDQDWQLYNYNQTSGDEFRDRWGWNPLVPGQRGAGPSPEGLMPTNWGDLLGLNESLLRERGYQGGLTGQEALPWLQANNLAVGQSGPLKDGLARHGNYYTQLFDTANGYAPLGTGYRTQNDYAEEGTGLATVALMALGGAAMNGGFGQPTPTPVAGGAVGAGGSMAGAGYVPAGLGIDTTLGVQIGADLANAGYFGAGAGGAGVAGGAAAAGGAGGGGGAGGLVAGNADKAALLGNAGYGQGMSGAATSAFDTVAGATGSNQLGAAAGNAMDGNWLQAAQNVGGNMNWLDWGKLGLQALGAYQGYQDGKDQTQTQSRDPWGPAQPYILEALQQGQKLNQQYQAQPFSPQQQTAYNNLGGLLNLANTNAPGLLSGFQANATGANNYDRSNPRKSLLGSAPMQGAWNPGLLSFFPQNGGGG